MRLTFSDIKAQHLRNINLVGSTDENILADFQASLGQRYQLMLAKMNNYRTQGTYSFTTVANQQSYPMPPGEVTVEGGFITIGSVNYPLRALMSRWNDEQLNAIQIQASAIPQFYFVEQDSFKIWPIPQAAYEGTLYYHYRDRDLSVPDYADGTVALTQGSNIVTVTGGTFTSAMIGRWFTVNDTSVVGQGYWYRITGYTDSTHVTLGTLTGNQVWNNPSVSGVTYRIGETPEVPEELHSALAWGTAADYYGGMQKDPTNAALYDNMFWTGNPGNTSRKEGDNQITGGLLGAMSRYADRDDRRIIKRKPRLSPLQYKVWATSLS